MTLGCEKRSFFSRVKLDKVTVFRTGLLKSQVAKMVSDIMSFPEHDQVKWPCPCGKNEAAFVSLTRLFSKATK